MLQPWLPIRRRLLMATAMTVAVSLLGCATSQPQVQPGIDRDDWISAEVRRRLQEDERVAAADIRVETQDRVVILAGVVSSLDEVRRALRIAGRVDGVEQVVNRLRIVPGAAREAARFVGGHALAAPLHVHLGLAREA